MRQLLITVSLKLNPIVGGVHITQRMSLFTCPFDLYFKLSAFNTTETEKLLIQLYLIANNLECAGSLEPQPYKPEVGRRRL